MADELKLGQRVQCKDDKGFTPLYGEQTPVYGRCYTIREIIAKPTGPCLRLREIVNPPAHYADGETECSFSATRFEAGVPPMPFFTVRGPLPISGGGGFAPTDIANMVAWYKADGITQYSDAGTTLATNTQGVQQWNDKSGNGYHLSANSGLRRLTYNTTGFNSRKTLTLATGNSLNSALGVAMGTGAECSAFFVGSIATAAATNTRFLGYGASGNNHDYETGGAALLARDGTGSQVYSLRAPTFAVPVVSVTLDGNSRIAFIYDGANVTGYINNVAGTPVATTTAFANGGQINLNTDGPGSGQDSVEGSGFVSEVVIYNRALTLTERNNLDTYFQSTWGL